MNKGFILDNLVEALEELQTTIEQIQTDNEYCEDELSVALAHAYHHLNTAWSTRNLSEEERLSALDEKFYEWRQFPRDINMGPVDYDEDDAD